MKIQTLYFKLVPLISLIVLNSCHKSDLKKEISPIQESTIKIKFFNNNRNFTQKENIIINYLQELNSKNNFVDSTVRLIGYPKWENSIYATAKPSLESKTSNENDSVNICFIPFIRPNENHVNSLLKLVMAPNDTTFNYICDWQFMDSSTTGLPATSQTLLLTLVDKQIFGNRLYKINDSLCYHSVGSVNNAKYFRILSSTTAINTTYNQRQSDYYAWITMTVCTGEYVPPNNGQVVGCDPGDPNCNAYIYQETCTDIQIYSLIVTGGGSSTGGSGSSTGGGGGTGNSGLPPTCLSIIPKGANVNPNCDPGWNPVPGSTGFPFNFNETNLFNGYGGKPILEYSNTQKCLGLNNMWDNYQNNEVLGYITADGKLIVTDILSLGGGSAKGLYKYTDANNVITYFYTYPVTQGAPTQSYSGIVNNGVNYFIPIVASIHTHTPCRTDGTNGITQTVSPEDATLAANHPGLRNWVIGCNAIANFNSSSQSFLNVQTGNLSTTCNNIY